MPIDPRRYKEAGVDIDKQYDAVGRGRAAIRSTFTAGVLSDLGSFGGLFDPARVGAGGEILVASTDGVGTKTKIAVEAGSYGTVGQCLVNHCVNDILVQGARPLFFLDYIGIGRMDPGVVGELLQGLARACTGNGCALLGGETAELPGIYRGGDFDLVGTIVGTVPGSRLLDGSRIREGDRILALPSTGLHTNGYSLARKILLEDRRLRLEDRLEGLEGSLGEALLAVHESYLGPVLPLLEEGDLVHACVHVTGGGLPDNLPRVLPEGLSARIEKAAVDRPAIFDLLLEEGGLGEEEAFRVFNMGFGFLLVVPADRGGEVRQRLEEEGAREVGVVLPGPREVELV